jgi:hypothetical protein
MRGDAEPGAGVVAREAAFLRCFSAGCESAAWTAAEIMTRVSVSASRA